MNLDVTDPTFVDDLHKSDAAVLRVAEWLRSEGYAVIIPPLVTRPSSEQAADYADSGDLKMLLGIEVKQRPDIDFTGAHDFPYPSIIVDQKRDFDRKREVPERYFIVNKSMTVAAVIGVRSTKQHWKVASRYNSKTGRTSEYYEVALQHVAFRNLDERIPQQ
jgi:hypothetical protein